jgi:hypothetical protein
VLTYSLEDFEVKYDASLLARIQGTNSESEALDLSSRTGNFRTDKGECKWICSIDGGGLRGIFPLRMLEQLERYYGKTCFEMFDMFAGTSTGSIIAALLASGYPLRDAISLYANEDIRRVIFKSNRSGQAHAFRYFDLRSLGSSADEITNLDDANYAARIADLIESQQGKVGRLINTVAEQLITPKYRKTGHESHEKMTSCCSAVVQVGSSRFQGKSLMW